MGKEILKIEDLSIEYNTEVATIYAVNGLDMQLGEGETLGLVGETGAGKTTTAKAIMRILPDKVGEVTRGKIYLEGKDIYSITEDEMCNIRGKIVSMVFQDPMSALNPIMTVGDQIKEVLQIHEKDLSKEKLDSKVDEMMEMVGIPANRKTEYPHEFSGGMKQRIVIAIALACEPKLILADEPTTALDVTIQAQMLALIKDLQRRLGTAMLLITHDFGVVAQICEKVAVMYAGEIVEYGPVEKIFDHEDLHPYTLGLFRAIPNLKTSAPRLNVIHGMMPDPSELIQGCHFAPRCKFATERCKQPQKMIETEPGHFIRCCLFDKSSEGDDHE